MSHNACNDTSLRTSFTLKAINILKCPLVLRYTFALRALTVDEEEPLLLHT